MQIAPGSKSLAAGGISIEKTCRTNTCQRCPKSRGTCGHTTDSQVVYQVPLGHLAQQTGDLHSPHLQLPRPRSAGRFNCRGWRWALFPCVAPRGSWSCWGSLLILRKWPCSPSSTTFYLQVSICSVEHLTRLFFLNNPVYSVRCFKVNKLPFFTYFTRTQVASEAVLQLSIHSSCIKYFIWQ